jgi:hemerythrin-like metal-binding domain
MNNLLIVWNPSDNLGIPIIDEQHRGIVATINSLHYLHRTKRTREMLNAIINMIREYTRIHFLTEETILAETGYPHLNAHRELHARLISKTFIVGNDSLLMNDPVKFLDFLKDWWHNHIHGQDRLYAEHVIKAMRLGDGRPFSSGQGSADAHR